MEDNLSIYNTLTRTKEQFKPLNPPFTGMYVCGPTVYGDAHLGHARPAITFDLVFRYLLHLGYKVRYVRNITDVGHLENDADEGEDKIGKKARLEQLEPMEIVQYYSDRYHHNMDQLNVKMPSIEPRASGHVIEQIELIKKIIDKGYAYVINGSVYFDVEKYSEHHNYGKLSGRKIDELIANTRELDGQEEKKNAFDFALWKKAGPEHIMHWPSPWGEGFPGWHTECTAMGTKYLGEYFDIHGGGMDLLFPHHEAEIAQSNAANGRDPVHIWMHNNMITINGQKMGKSLGNAVSLNEFFSGQHSLLDKPYSPMTIRFFILQAHYRSTLDFSNEALQASEKGLRKLMAAMRTLVRLTDGTTGGREDGKRGQQSAVSSQQIQELQKKCYAALDDDFNSPVLIAHLFEGVKLINTIKDGNESVSTEDLALLKKIFNDFVVDILGLEPEETSGEQERLISGLMDTILSIRQESREKKDYTISDKIRKKMAELKIQIKDTKEGASWELIED